jgi:acyl-CoA synthetase (AMP-forming)/AMP-acid ligase II
MVGGTSVILPSGQFDANEVVDALEREQVTGCYFVPTQWQQIRAVPGIADRTARSSMPRLVSASRDVDVIAHCAPRAINR